MKRIIIMTRDVTESVTLEVEGRNRSHCEEIAIALAKNPNTKWELDDGNTPQPAYITHNELVEPEPVACGQCNGSGTIEGGLSGSDDDEECPVCNGTGTLPVEAA